MPELADAKTSERPADENAIAAEFDTQVPDESDAEASDEVTEVMPAITAEELENPQADAASLDDEAELAAQWEQELAESAVTQDQSTVEDTSEPETQTQDDTLDSEEEAAVLAEWEQQLVNESATLTAPEVKEDNAAQDELTGPAASASDEHDDEANIAVEWEQQLEQKQAVENLELAASEADEAIPGEEAASNEQQVAEETDEAQWEQQLLDDAEQPVADLQQEKTLDDGFVAFSETQASQIADQEQAEAEREAALAAAWEQGASTKVESNPEDQEQAQSEPQQTGQPETEINEAEDEDIDTGPPVKLTDSKAALSEMWDDLTEEPLPSEADLESMFEEIRQLDQSEPASGEDSRRQSKPLEKDELKSILSSIPSFSQMNKKSDR